jgi:uncharacterized membrane protein YecN with MAPEG domain
MAGILSFTTVFCAAILGLLGALLTVNVIVNRVRSKVEAGDGGVAKLAQAIRAHGNFVEQAPLALIVLAAADAAGTRPVVVEALGVALILSRLAAAYALNQSLANTPLRQFGGGVSVLVAAAAAIATLLALAGVR